MLRHLFRNNSPLISASYGRHLSSTRAKGNVKYFPPSTLATRVIPTPLVTVMASGLESDSESKVLNSLCAEASSRGFATFQFSLPYVHADGDTASTVLDKLAANLRSSILSTEYPFPPILFACQLGSLVAQTYVSSYPVSALILDDPIPCAKLSTWPGPANKLPLHLDEFDFEPKFPLLVVGYTGNDNSQKENRLVKEGADFVEVDGGLSGRNSPSIPHNVLAALSWLEEMGF